MTAVTAHEAAARYGRETGAARGAMAKRYLDWGGAGKDDLLRYVAHLEREGLRPGTVDLHIRTVRAFFRHFGLPAPRIPGHRYDGHDARRPALARGLIEAMIAAAKDGRLSNRQAALVALATTYGPRAGEMAALRDEDLDLPGERIYLHTLKHGRRRWTWLPPVLHPYLDLGWHRESPSSVEAIFGSIWAAVSEQPKPQGVAWHSVRRALARDLRRAGCTPEAITRFMRWKGGGKDAMADLYSQPNLTVGVEGEEAVEPEQEGRREADGECWERHPYLRLWR